MRPFEERDGIERIDSRHHRGCDRGASRIGAGAVGVVVSGGICYELAQAGVAFQRQVPIPLNYKGVALSCGYRLDFLVEDEVIVETKAVEQLLPVHSAQLLTYLKSTGKQVGLLINFNVPVLKNGIRRMVNDFAGQGR